ncbi:MAG: tRNA 4-thiouridine(8) synthase ThiI [Acidobacteria bacterium]|nr:MAG: tRNA 4-thiouridine(8) synthase ThiI [Acidobacteriota bacterium]
MSDPPVPRLELHIRSPEITLKGRNQSDFWSQLRGNIRHTLRSEGISWPMQRRQGRLYVEAQDYTEASLKSAVRTIDRVCGVHSVAVAERLARDELLRDGELDRPRVESIVVRLARESYRAQKTFAVRVHRVDKKFLLSSAEMERWLGQVVRDRTEWERVRLDDPDMTIHVDIYTDAAFFYTERPRGIGGLPVASSGHVVSLLSGGIDSPVASFLLARRGCTVDFFHMSATHMTEGELERSVPGRLAQKLSRFTLRSRLFVVPYTHFDLALRGKNTGYETVLFRRFLFRVAEALALKTRAIAIVTGDSLSQVASQTIENLVSSEKAVAISVLRPLLAMDKQAIMKVAEQIDTYAISIEPYKDCCALFTRRTRTKTYDEVLTRMETKLFPDYEALIASSLADILRVQYDCGKLLSTEHGVDALGAEAAIEASRLDSVSKS